MTTRTDITARLGIRHPIIQGPFGGGLSTTRLAATVSNAGGLGSYGAHNLSPAEIHDIVSRLRVATDQPFAINLWVSDHDAGGLSLTPEGFETALRRFQPFYDELGIAAPAMPDRITWRFEDQIDALIEAAPRVFSFVFGIPSAAILEECRRRNIVTIGAATTVAEGRALAAAGIDMVLATGCEAGGHRPSFLRPAEDSLVGTLALVPQMVDAVDIPVIAAGGIADGRGVAAALALGAQGVQVGTAFLACEESGAPSRHRERLLSGEAELTTLSRAFTGRLARFIPNDYLAAIEAAETELLPFPIQSWFAGHIKRAAADQQNPAYMALYAGQSAPLLRHRNAEALMTSLIAAIN